MHHVTIVGFDQALASAITGMYDLFRLAGVTWARIHGDRPDPRFQVQLATVDGQPCHCINGMTLPVQGRLPAIGATDLILVPTIGGPIPRVLAANTDLCQWLRDQYAAGVAIAGNCTGTFLLAEAGLLDGRQATTHWGWSDHFRARYPQVDLRPEKMMTADGKLFCAGGGMAWWDLGVYLVEYFYGADLARELAKAFVVDVGRTSQSAYSALSARRYHQDSLILELQDWLERHFPESLDLPALAARARLGERSFLRRFKAATGDTPRAYIQNLRLEAAKRALESPHLSVAQITRQVGYEDVSSFTRLFKRATGLSPSAYRSRFAR